MRRYSPAVIILSLLLFAGSTGCASVGTYFKDRGNDFLDCFNLDAGYGYGLDARVRVGHSVSFCVGGSNVHKYGMRGRHFGEWRDIRIGYPVSAFFAIAPCPASSSSSGEVCTQVLMALLGGIHFEENGEGLGPGGKGGAAGGYDSVNFWILSLRQTRLENAWEEFRVLDVEAGCTLGFVGVNVGFSLGHFADFVLGWFTLDVASDDTATRERAGEELKMKGQGRDDGVKP